jgi:hypothetical protein
VVASVLVLAAALVGFVVSDRPDAGAQMVADKRQVAAEQTPEPLRTQSATPDRKQHEPSARRDGVNRRAQEPPRRVPGVYVEVYNNGGSSDATATAAERLQALGWQVVGTDDWYGTIPASTVYWPSESYQPAARRLARALGIERTWPAVAPMRFDRLTVILTADFSG